MSDSLRRLNATGIDRFRDYVADLRADGTAAPRMDLLTDNAYSEPIAGAGGVEATTFTTKYSAAVYLTKLLAPLRPADVDRDVGLWAWLALFHFDQVCPLVGGKRSPSAAARYIFEPFNHQRRYRHILWTPYWILRMMPDHNRLYLNEKVTVHGDLVEQTLSRLVNVIRIRSFREVVDLLYFDEKRGTYKRGTLSRKRRGSLYPRLLTRLRQMSRTYDVAAMPAHQIIATLGDEFSGWAKTADS